METEMNRLLTAFALSTALMTPAFAQDAVKGVACGAVLTMSQADQKAAMEMAMTSDKMAAQAAMGTDDAMASDDAMAMMVKMCTTNPDMMLRDAMHSMN